MTFTEEQSRMQFASKRKFAKVVFSFADRLKNIIVTDKRFVF